MAVTATLTLGRLVRAVTLAGARLARHAAFALARAVRGVVTA